jgi:vancomycin resistance protein YoaR
VRRSVGLPLAILVGALFGAGAVPLVEPRLPTSPVVRGLRVDGRPFPEGAEPGSWLRAEQARLRRTLVTARVGSEQVALSLRELGLEVDVLDTLRRMEAVGRSGSVLRRLRETASARAGAVDVPLAWRFDEDTARATLGRFGPALERAPVDARLDLAGHRKIPDEPGQALDLDVTIAELRRRAIADGTFSLVPRLVEASITVTDLADIDVTKVLGRYETRFATFKTGRAANVALAAGLLDGLVLRAGGSFSFNERVGPRTAERGFQQAPEIVGDELTVGIGGGTCQVASTLHGAALYGGMEILERRSHSRPSDYIPLGLDATVSYGQVDLRIRNPYPFTVAIHAGVPEPGLLRIELLGGQEVDDVKYAYGVSRVEPFLRRITVRPFLKDGRVVRHQKGTRGMDVHSTVVIVYRGGRSETRTYYSGYRASPEVYWVAPDYDPNGLPPLPEHARGVEGRLHLDGSDVYPSL